MFCYLILFAFIALTFTFIYLHFLFLWLHRPQTKHLTRQGSIWRYSKCSKRYWSNNKTTWWPHHTLDQDPHPAPNAPNLEDSPLNPQDQPADGPFNPLPPQSNLQPVQACSDQRSQQRSIPASTRTSAPDLQADTVGIGVFSHLENVGNMSWLGQIFPGYSNQENCWIIYCAY